MNMRVILLFFFATVISFCVEGQNLSKFPEKPEEYVSKAEDVLNGIGREEAEKLSEQFVTMYEGGQFNDKQKQRIIAMSNVMADRNMLAYPSFEHFIASVVAYKKRGGGDEQFYSWLNVLEKVAKNQDRGINKKFKAFIEFSKDLFARQHLYTSRSKNWAIETNNFSFHYEDQKPYSEIAETRLRGYSSRDTIFVLNTKGRYYPLSNKWQGDKGKVDWETAGFDKGVIAAAFDDYTIDLSNSSYTVDSARLSYPDFLSKTLTGRLKDKISAYTSESRITYPQFKSTQENVYLEDLDSHLDYEGGFSLEGNSILGTGSKDDKARLIFKTSDGNKALTALSEKVEIQLPKEVSAEKAEIVIPLESDSIYHPESRIKYRMDKQELTVYRESGGSFSTYFNDTYHQHEVKADKFVWNLDSTKIEINQISRSGKDPVTFKSTNYFRQGELQQYQGIMDYNPVMVLQRMVQDKDRRDFYAKDIAKRMNMNYNEKTIKRMLYRLRAGGYIKYDEETGDVYVRVKTTRQVMANKGFIDYDNIKMTSLTSEANAELDLENYNMDVNGVENVLLSDSSYVVIFPKDGEITIKKNRDMDFSGTVLAGRVDFVGDGFDFKYDSFSVDLTNLAAAIINVPTGERKEDGSPKLRPLNSKIEGLTGYLEIDKPNNKSGKKDFPSYPIFHNQKKSYVYYEYDFIYDSAYTSEDFYFELDPFTFDSLKTFDPYLSDFKGRMVSADIFPVFEEQLKIQDDLSLGFQRTTPQEGYPLYQGKGTYTDSIFLSNKGFRGKGRVDYRFVTIESDDILFFPDSMNAITDSFKMANKSFEGETYPKVVGADNDIHWRPYMDSMFIEQRSTPFEMYDVEASLDGDLILTDDGLRGNGSFQWKEAALASDEFDFRGNELESDSMSLEILGIDKEKVTFNTPNVAGEINFDDNVGEFKSNREDIATTFDANQYKTAINEFTWDIDKNVLDFQAPPGEGAYFVSTHPDQDSLKFRGQRAYFDLPTSVLEVYEIPYIPVADARIDPDSNKVVIESQANMRTLENAEIVADTSNEYHRFYDATVDIEGAKRYHGSGKYDYEMRNGNIQTYPFDSIGSRKIESKKFLGKEVSHRTYGSTTINENDSLFMNPKFRFKGDVELQASKKNMFFDGFAKLDVKKHPNIPKRSTSWFAFDDTIDPNNFVLNYGKPTNPDGDTLFTGFTYDQSSIEGLKGAVMEKNASTSAQPVLKADGIAKYRPNYEEFVFGDKDKIVNGEPHGDILRYSDTDREIHGEGNINLHLNFNPITMTSAGTIEDELDTNVVDLNMLTALHLPIDDELISLMAKNLNSYTYDNKQVDYTTDQFKHALAELTKENKVDKTLEELNKTGAFERPNNRDETFIFSDLKMTYNPKTQTYQSRGRTGLSFVGEMGIHKHIRGFVEFGKRRTSDFFNIYFESVAGDWYFLTYKNDILQILSSNEKFNKKLSGISPQKRKTKLGKERFFLYSIATFNDKRSFVKRMRKGGEPPALDQKPDTVDKRGRKTSPQQGGQQTESTPTQGQQQQPPSKQEKGDEKKQKPSYNKDQIGVPGQKGSSPNNKNEKGDKSSQSERSVPADQKGGQQKQQQQKPSYDKEEIGVPGQDKPGPKKEESEEANNAERDKQDGEKEKSGDKKSEPSEGTDSNKSSKETVEQKQQQDEESNNAKKEKENNDNKEQEQAGDNKNESDNGGEKDE